MNRFLRILKQPSTIRGIALVASAFGIAVTGGQTEAIVAAVPALIGVYDSFRDEEKGK